jgi:hypothetical protein
MSISKAEAMERIRNQVRARRPISIPAAANSVAIEHLPRVTVLARRRRMIAANEGRTSQIGTMARRMKARDLNQS